LERARPWAGRVPPGMAAADRAPLPTHDMGKPRVDVADRSALRDAMEGG